MSLSLGQSLSLSQSLSLRSAHESISEAAIRILRYALMTATGGQIAFMRASTKIIVLMRALAKIRGEQRLPPWYVCISNLHFCDLQ